MKTKFYLLICTLCAISFSILAQDITVEPGDNLIEIIKEAPDGAVITVKPGVYRANYNEELEENANIHIDGKSLTIKGESKDDKPIIYIRAIDIAGVIESLTFENLEVSGLPVDPETLTEDSSAEGEELVGSYFVNMTDTLESIESLTIKGCVIRNLHRSVIRGDRAEHPVGTITVDDCIIHDIRSGSSYGVFRLQSRLELNTFTLKNSTLYDVEVGIIQSENTAADFPKIVLVENCTFYNIGGGVTSRYQFDFKSSTSLNFTMRHNILGKTNSIGLESDFDILGWRFNFGGTTSTRMIANNIAPDYLVLGNSEIFQGSFGDIQWSQSQFNIDLDPEFANPAIADFTLPQDSELLEASLEGEIVGDPRWNPIKVSTPAISSGSTMSVFPNPSRGTITIEMERPGVVSIYSMLGAKVREIMVTQSRTQIDISDLSTGIYLIKSFGSTVKLMVR